MSDVFGVDPQAFADEGAFDRFVDIDSLLYVDPFLLRTATAPELQGAYPRFRAHFENIIRLLAASHGRGDRFHREAVRLLTFPEPPNVALGYSVDHIRGSGIGATLASSLADTASEIIEAGIRDPEIFELVGLLEPGVGADRISDMTVRLIMPHLLSFTDRVVARLHLRADTTRYKGTEYRVPRDPDSGKPIVLVPTELLRDLPVARDWSDVDRVCAHNSELRRRVNRMIGRTWRHATRYVSKRELRQVLLRYPGVFEDLITQYRSKRAQPYDFQRDPAGEFIWYSLAQRAVQQYPLDLRPYRPVSPANLHGLVRTMCENFKRLVEVNGWHAHLYDDDGHLRHEKFAQLLFFGVADFHCRANDLDLNREPNAGRGPVDFKISLGYRARVTVEVKYSHSRKLRHGYETQLPEYNRAEQASSSIYLVIRTGESRQAMLHLQRLRTKAIRAGQRAPEIIIVDGRRRRSASRM